jgi:acyl-CoA synthetase (AMP-forming)/AMP-acid ligase II
MQLAPSDALGRAFGASLAQQQLAALGAAVHGDGPLADETGRWTRAEAAQATDRLAAAIDAAVPGDGPGHLIAVLLPDDRRYAAAIRAAWQCGHDVVCLQQQWPADSIAEVLASAEVDLLLADDPGLRWPGGPVLFVPSPAVVMALPAPTADQRATWAESSATRRAAS